MGSGVESRFERYAEKMVEALGHADRATPARWYLRGLMLPGQRKSVEPMAARVHPQDVRSAHQSMHHLVADSEWSDTALLAAVAREVVPVLSREGQARCFWIIDDTSYRKYGKHSVGVARQYCGHLGKTENCQVAVSLSLATEEGSLPLAYRLYLPHEWTENKKRCERAGVPRNWLCHQGENRLGADRGGARRRHSAWHGAHGCWLRRRGGDARSDDGTRLVLCGRRCEPADHGVVGGPSTRAGAAPADPWPTPHPRATRRDPPADRRARTGAGAARGELAHHQLARRNERTAVLALRACARARGARRSAPRRRMAAHRMAER